MVDEANRMAHMGFLPAVCRILDATPSERQTLLFSATLDGDVDVLVEAVPTPAGPSRGGRATTRPGQPRVPGCNQC